MFLFGALVFVTVVLQTWGAPSSGPVAQVEDITLNETDDSVYVFVWTIAGVIVFGSCLFLLFLVCRRNATRRKRFEDEAGAGEDVKQWYYVQDGEQLGPFSSYAMRVHFRADGVDRGTLCKLVWQAEFVPVSHLFPDSGTEFNMEPKLTNEDAHTDWHRHSVLARPSGRPPPAISWFYSKDDKVYGPFEMGKMRHWFVEKYFAADTLARIGDPHGSFHPISDFYPDQEKAFDGVPLIPQDLSEEAPPDAADRGRGSFYTPGSGSGLAFPPAALPSAPQIVGRPADAEAAATESAAPSASKKKKKAREGEESGDAPKKKKGTKKKKPREDGSAPEEVDVGND